MPESQRCVPAGITAHPPASGSGTPKPQNQETDLPQLLRGQHGPGLQQGR